MVRKKLKKKSAAKAKPKKELKPKKKEVSEDQEESEAEEQDDEEASEAEEESLKVFVGNIRWAKAGCAPLVQFYPDANRMEHGKTIESFFQRAFFF
eukprot:s884_g22.t1